MLADSRLASIPHKHLEVVMDGQQLVMLIDAAKTWRYWQRREVTRSSEESKRSMRARDNLLAAIDELFGETETAGSITCPICQAVSWNPQDVVEGYCGSCHTWTSPPLRERADAKPADPR